jgi:hypothetical protein
MDQAKTFNNATSGLLIAIKDLSGLCFHNITGRAYLNRLWGNCSRDVMQQQMMTLEYLILVTNEVAQENQKLN